MNSRTVAPAIACLVLTMSLAACMNDEPTRPRAAVDLSIAAHDPSMHGVQATIVAAALPTYSTLDAGSAGGTGGTVALQVDAAGTIPRFSDSFIRGVAVFGYAWADLGSGRAVIAVIHPAIGRDSNQNPDAWHTHPVQLGAGTANSDFCVVSIGTSQAGIAITGDRMRVNIAVNQAGVATSDLDVAAAFIVQPDPGCAASGLGVVILSAASL